MGLDWIIECSNDYDGPKYHRANGLAWVLEECGYLESSKKCYGEIVSGEQLTKVTDENMQVILHDLTKIMIEDKYPETILDFIEKSELLEHLEEAKTILTKILNYQGNNKPCIYGDY